MSHAASTGPQKVTAVIQFVSERIVWTDNVTRETKKELTVIHISISKIYLFSNFRDNS
jgi:hypothetical protein